MIAAVIILAVVLLAAVIYTEKGIIGRYKE
jgi:hypothetical protein